MSNSPRMRKRPYQVHGYHRSNARQSVRHHIMAKRSPTAKHCEPAERDRTRANTVCARTMDPIRRPIAGETLAEQRVVSPNPFYAYELSSYSPSDPVLQIKRYFSSYAPCYSPTESRNWLGDELALVRGGSCTVHTNVSSAFLWPLSYDLKLVQPKLTRVGRVEWARQSPPCDHSR